METTILKGSLAKEFEIKDLGSLKNFLGIEVVKVKTMDFPLPKEVCIGLVEGFGNDGI